MPSACYYCCPDDVLICIHNDYGSTLKRTIIMYHSYYRFRLCRGWGVGDDGIEARGEIKLEAGRGNA
jgi:hypothetical protein